MSWMETCTDGAPRGGLPGELDVVREHVAAALSALRVARTPEWVSSARDGYVAILEEQIELVRRLGAQVDAADGAVRAAQSTREAAGGLGW